MHNILQDPNHSALKQVIEANTIESFKTWGKQIRYYYYIRKTLGI